MLETIDRSDNRPYRITCEPFAGHVTVRAGDRVIADTGAAKVMQETRLKPTLYFPRDDIDMARLVRSNRRTFCPFKGIASYWHVDTGNGLLENTAWSYEHPLEDGRSITGDIGFMPKSGLVVESSVPLPPIRDDGHATGPLIEWLLRKASSAKSPQELTMQLGETLLKTGMPLWRLRISNWTLHPLLAGWAYTWYRGADRVETVALPHDALDSPAYLNSPVRYVTEGLGGVRQRLDVNEMEFDFPVLAELKAAGATEYVAMPLYFSDGSINTVTLTSDDPKGFSTADLGPVFESASVIGRFLEVMNLRANTQSLLVTYLGERTGERVLSGKVQRGDREDIRAAILFCDLRDSTGWLERLPRDDYLALLNGFFETSVEAIDRHGGEVLKFIGDGVLAIFPADGDDSEASRHAVAAAGEIVDGLEGVRPDGGSAISSAIGIHFGNVTYGNVGAPGRLDFTATGKATNIAARLSELSKQSGHPIIVSGPVSRAAGGSFRSIGEYLLHGMSKPVEAFLPEVGA